MVAGPGMEQVNAVAEILLDADAGINMLIKRQPRLGRDVVAACHPLLLGQAVALLPAPHRVVVISRQAYRLSPRLGPDAAARQALIQHLIVEGVIAQQPCPDPPALPQADITHQAAIALGHRILVPGEKVAVILQRHEPAALAAGKAPFLIHQ